MKTKTTIASVFRDGQPTPYSEVLLPFKSRITTSIDIQPLPPIQNWDHTGMAVPPKGRGVYAILHSQDGCDFEIVYIGSSRHLKQRISGGHEIIKELKKIGGALQVRFFATPIPHTREPELIRLYQPRMNVNHNPTGNRMPHKSKKQHNG